MPVLTAIIPSRSHPPLRYTGSRHNSRITLEIRAVFFSVGAPLNGRAYDGGRRLKLRVHHENLNAAVRVEPALDSWRHPAKENSDAAACSTPSGLLQVQATAIALSAILICCPPSGASDLVEAQKAFGDAGRLFEQAVVQALNFPSGDATPPAQQKAGSFLDFSTWHLPTSPSQLFSGLASKESVCHLSDFLHCVLQTAIWS